MRTIIISLLLFLQVDALAQSRIKFRTINQLGVISGKSDGSWLAQSINGIAYKSFSLGFGVGTDQYYFKSMPLFVDLRKKIFNRDNTPFVYADYGANHIFKKKETTPWMVVAYDHGKFYDLGVGYSWKMEQGGDFVLSVGYTQKTFIEKYYYHWVVDPKDVTTIDITMRRICLKAGLSF